eukprot:CAMPEP_0197687322 /NCGR_PEP_ID=MMETSP1338-20131121/103820_1 /TAXON_ID=43686 ORGANISM="Pelagodinium beii, Strain RCC1491" /NCGR_SAMPLE_ID=MMETSP1338 /ASSEMBLY_ACC=CAM_ASM_000754 /LENGTH=87 /DNA_ID=CAMNT_0043269401 /DNA_START=158 /DNA_END=421 /DNA_ORIENTATION=-
MTIFVDVHSVQQSLHALRVPETWVQILQKCQQLVGRQGATLVKVEALEDCPQLVLLDLVFRRLFFCGRLGLFLLKFCSASQESLHRK